MMRFTREDAALIRAAASLAAHAPERMRAGHLAARLEALARRMPAVAEEATAAATELQTELRHAA